MTAEGTPLADDFHIGDHFHFEPDLSYSDCFDIDVPLNIVWSNVIDIIEAFTIDSNPPLKA